MLDIWTNIDGYYPYQASQLGNIRNGRSKLVLRQNLSSNGNYSNTTIRINGKTKTISVHKLVCIAFEGLPIDGMEVRHIDGNGHNNMSYNLCWGTRQENLADKLKHGTIAKGQNHGKSVLTQKQVDEIKQELLDYRYGMLTRLSTKYNVSVSTINQIKRNKNWK